MTSIRIVGLEKSFSTVKALQNVNLSVNPGELFTLLGPSGCGKTTLLRTIAGFYRQDAGDIYLGDELVNDMPAYKRETGMVFQNYAVFPHMTVAENVAYGLKVRKVHGEEITKRVDAALRSVRLEGYGSRTPDQLSGGQQQRVGLARALVIKPRVLLLDEPLSNLDAKLRIEMRSEIHDIQKELGITAVYVTHDQEEAPAISDRIAVLASGVIQQMGTPWEIYKSPQNIFVATFVGNMNLIEGEICGESGTRIRVKTSGGELIAPKPMQSRQSTKVLIGFRPEEGRINPAPDSENRVEACIKGNVFLGSTANLALDLNGTVLALEYHRPASNNELKAGSHIAVGLPSQSLLLFDPETKRRIPAMGDVA